MDGPATALHMSGLTKFYGRQCGVADVDLDVTAGEVFGFLGPNGAGKTTTIRMVLGLLHPTRGQCEVFGLNITSNAVAARALMGYLPGDLAMYDRMKVRDLLKFLGDMRGGVSTAAYESLAERFQLKLDRKIKDLSRGNRQKIGVVQAFMHSPPLLVLDEPTSGLDPVVQLEFQALVKETVNTGASVFLSSHILTEVEQMADRVGIVVDGHLTMVDSVDLLRERARRRIEMDFPAAPPGAVVGFPGLQDVQVHGRTVTCWVAGPIGSLLQVAVANGVVDVHTHDADLEDAFLGYVRAGGRS